MSASIWLTRLGLGEYCEKLQRWRKTKAGKMVEVKGPRGKVSLNEIRDMGDDELLKFGVAKDQHRRRILALIEAEKASIANYGCSPDAPRRTKVKRGQRKRPDSTDTDVYTIESGQVISVGAEFALLQSSGAAHTMYAKAFPSQLGRATKFEQAIAATTTPISFWMLHEHLISYDGKARLAQERIFEICGQATANTREECEKARIVLHDCADRMRIILRHMQIVTLHDILVAALSKEKGVLDKRDQADAERAACERFNRRMSQLNDADRKDVLPDMGGAGMVEPELAEAYALHEAKQKSLQKAESAEGKEGDGGVVEGDEIGVGDIDIRDEKRKKNKGKKKKMVAGKKAKMKVKGPGQEKAAEKLNASGSGSSASSSSSSSSSSDSAGNISTVASTGVNKTTATPMAPIKPGPWMCAEQPSTAGAALIIREALEEVEKWFEATSRIQEVYRCRLMLLQGREDRKYYSGLATKIQTRWRIVSARKDAQYLVSMREAPVEELFSDAENRYYYFDSRDNSSSWYPPPEGVLYKPFGWWVPKDPDPVAQPGFCQVCITKRAVRRCNQHQKTFCFTCWAEAHDVDHETSQHTFRLVNT